MFLLFLDTTQSAFEASESNDNKAHVVSSLKHCHFSRPVSIIIKCQVKIVPDRVESQITIKKHRLISNSCHIPEYHLNLSKLLGATSLEQSKQTVSSQTPHAKQTSYDPSSSLARLLSLPGEHPPLRFKGF